MRSLYDARELLGYRWKKHSRPSNHKNGGESLECLTSFDMVRSRRQTKKLYRELSSPSFVTMTI